MKLFINIEDDKEIKAAFKQTLQAQVRNFVKEEFNSNIQEAIIKLLNKIENRDYMKSVIKDQYSKIIDKELKSLCKEAVKERLDDIIGKEVEKIIKSKLNSMFKQE